MCIWRNKNRVIFLDKWYLWETKTLILLAKCSSCNSEILLLFRNEKGEGGSKKMPQ